MKKLLFACLVILPALFLLLAALIPAREVQAENITYPEQARKAAPTPGITKTPNPNRVTPTPTPTPAFLAIRARNPGLVIGGLVILAIIIIGVIVYYRKI